MSEPREGARAASYPTAVPSPAGQAAPSQPHPVDLLIGVGRFREAAWLLEHYIEEFPDDMATIANLGMCYWNTKRGPAAIELFKRALAIEPDNHKLLNNLGRCAADLSYHEEAIPALRRLIALAPDSKEGHAFLGQSLRHLRRFDEAYEAYRRYPRDAAAVYDIDSSEIICAEMDERTTRAHCMALRQAWNRNHRLSWRYHAWPNPRDPEKRLTIGYLGADFRSHSVSLAFSPLLLGRDRDNFKVVCFYVEAVRDTVTQEFENAADLFFQVPDCSHDELARIIHAQQVDILVDLSGHTPGTRLRTLTAKPAPIQASMLGAVGSTGVAEIDYVIADAGFVPPEEAARYTERVWHLPAALHMRPAEPLPDVSPSPCEANGFITFGTFHHFSKVTDPTMAAWGTILRAMPDAKLLVKDWVCMTEPGRARILRETGLDETRVIFAGPELRNVHLANHAKIDIHLDTWPQNGGVTTLECVAMGVPVVSLYGDRPNQRGSVSIARHLPEDVVLSDTVDGYIEAVLDVARSRDWLIGERFKRRARFQATPLGDSTAWVRDVETAYRQMWRQWCAENTEEKP